MGKIDCSYIDHMGNDSSVVRAARVSFAQDNFSGEILTQEELEEIFSKDSKLIRYLAKHNHWTPFAHTAITLRCSAPVPIRTQCFKHKQGFVENEESRRYIKSTPEFYIPDHFRNAPEEGKEKQGSWGVHILSELVRREYIQTCQTAINTYEQWIDDGICPEQARFVLPQGCIVNWYWTGSLSAYARFYKQRTDPHAQQEVRDLAIIVDEIIKPLYPRSWEELTRK